jgi:Periplasmic binding protein
VHCSRSSDGVDPNPREEDSHGHHALAPPAALALLSAVPAIAQQGVSGTEIVVGCSNSFTGPGALAFLSEQLTKFGIDLYFRVVNEAGRIHGRKVRTIYYYYYGFKLQEAVANTKKLVEQDKVFAVLAPVGTASVAATLEYLEQNGTGSLRRAAGGAGRSAGGRRRLLLADRGGIRLMDRHSARSAAREGRDHRPNRKSQFKSVRGTRFAVRDKEGARCRSGCQRG